MPRCTRWSSDRCGERLAGGWTFDPGLAGIHDRLLVSLAYELLANAAAHAAADESS
jgi:hypothetical protein